MGLDGALQPARHRRQNSRAPARSAVDIDVSAAASADRRPHRGFCPGAAIGAAPAV